MPPGKHCVGWTARSGWRASPSVLCREMLLRAPLTGTTLGTPAEDLEGLAVDTLVPDGRSLRGEPQPERYLSHPSTPSAMQPGWNNRGPGPYNVPGARPSTS